MDMYSAKGKSTGAKTFLALVQAVLILLAAWILFGSGAQFFRNWPGVSAEMPIRRTLLIIFSVVSLLRFSISMYVFLQRKISVAELISVPVAFFLYYVVFAILVLPYGGAFDILDAIGTLFFFCGAGINLLAEWQRYAFKLKPENEGKLFTGGLFARSMHMNYLGDIIWVTGYALVAHNPYGFLIPLLLGVFFAFSGIPALDAYLAKRYGEDFKAYAAKTKRLVPGLW